MDTKRKKIEKGIINGSSTVKSRKNIILKSKGMIVNWKKELFKYSS